MTTSLLMHRHATCPKCKAQVECKPTEVQLADARFMRAWASLHGLVLEVIHKNKREHLVTAKLVYR